MTSDERSRADERSREEETADEETADEQTISEVRVTVRYFGAAAAAAAATSETVSVEPGASIGDLAAHLGDINQRLATVLLRCAYLCDGIAVRDTKALVRTGQIIDVLPPFAGG